ncbi:nucleotidyltransferase family protein [Sulfurimonas sediminis]|uniref:Nucleotidyltransferase family protein n=1 Tax=Sulfurimonas sediminis TaxID=2590020 RepID=A0A7M1B471_9BACT|nr:nucleotidyltransferase family protein [Sulfurimonas sediminis]QOP44521.1 nucleotidyltransferase family protein [Sulfurimonas sediminis]
MKAMILAAGRGERMRPLSDTVPKPLLHVKGKALIEWHIEKLAHKGFDEIIINIGHLGFKIPAYLGDGSKWGVRILYSDEQKSGALESAGGIKIALPLLGDAPFLVVNGDIFCEYDYNPNFKLTDTLAHLVLVPNPAHNPKGDFGLKNGLVTNEAKTMYTFSGIGYYHPKLFENEALQKSPLAPLLRKNIDKSLVSGELFNKMWHDIGTPQRLQEINEN